MRSNLYIVTGGSRGFGRSLVLQLLKQNHQVISLARTQISQKDLGSHSKSLVQYRVDFSKNFQKKVTALFKKISLKNIQSVFLINNAGVIEPIDRVEKLKADQVEQHLKINLLAPMVLSQIFLEVFKSISPKVIVQITSGAATRTVEGWSVYCAGKAGLNMFNEVLALQMQNDTSFKAIGYSPGIMDTDMQSKIRSRSVKQFPDVDGFKKYKTEKKLRSPDYVASDLLRILMRISELKSGQVYRVS